MKADPKAPDDTVTVESLIEAMVSFGSSKTVADRRVAFGERAGPFGTLLMASMDGSGDNRHREWETMRRLATDVRPHIQAAFASEPVPA